MEAKHTLSARSRSARSASSIAGRSLEVHIAREQFEEMTADLLERTAYTSRQLLAAAEAAVEGRQPRAPGGRLDPHAHGRRDAPGADGHRARPHGQSRRGRRPRRGAVCPLPADEAQGGAAGAFQVTNVNAHSLGIEGIDHADAAQDERDPHPPQHGLCRRSTRSGSSPSRRGSGRSSCKVLEGESSMPGECTAIGRTVVRDLPAGLPKGWPVEVTFEYGVNGRLSVRAVVPGTHHEAQLDLEREAGLSDAGMARWKAPIAAAAGFGVFGAIAHDALGGNPAAVRPQPAAVQPRTAAVQPRAAAVWPAGRSSIVQRRQPMVPRRSSSALRRSSSAPRRQAARAPFSAPEFSPTNPQPALPGRTLARRRRRPMVRAPQTVSPAPLASSPFSGLPMPGAPLGPAPTIEAPPSGSPLFGPMLPLGPMPTIARARLSRGLPRAGTNLQGAMPMGGLPPLAAPVGGLAGEIVPLVPTPGNFVVMSGMPGENMPAGGPAAAMPFGGMHPANVPLRAD